MRNFTTILIASAAFIATTAKANESIVINPAVLYLSSENESIEGGQESKSKTTQLNLNFGLGYQVNGGFYLGLKYLSHKTDAVTSSATQELSGYGPSLGFIAPMGFSVLGTYFLKMTETTNQTSGNQSVSSEKRSKQALMIDFGYQFKIKTWAFGPQLSYLVIDWKETATNNLVTTFEKNKDTMVNPYFAFWLYF